MFGPRSNFEQFYKIPGNEKCCDCGTSEPRWASINLGITLCIACSGVHRSLGVHYSKVRSLTLDGWEPEIVKVMMELGNDVVNDIFEANYDKFFSTTATLSADEAKNSITTAVTSKIQRATSDCDNSVREAWIKAKYVDKLFVAPISDIKDGKPNRLDDVIFSESGWFVRRRRRIRIRLRTEKATGTEKHSATDDSASGSELSVDSNRTNNDDLSFGSDNDSTDDDEENAVGLTEEKLCDFNSDLLLYRATMVHNLPVMCYALAAGASKNWANPNDSYRLHLHQAVLTVRSWQKTKKLYSNNFDFVFQGSVTACEFLLLNGCQINAVDAKGYTSLHLATEKGFTAQAYLLLKHQAKHDIVANDNKQPIDIAVDQANADIVTL